MVGLTGPNLVDGRTGGGEGVRQITSWRGEWSTGEGGGNFPFHALNRDHPIGELQVEEFSTLGAQFDVVVEVPGLDLLDEGYFTGMLIVTALRFGPETVIVRVLSLTTLRGKVVFPVSSAICTA